MRFRVEWFGCRRCGRRYEVVFLMKGSGWETVSEGSVDSCAYCRSSRTEFMSFENLPEDMDGTALAWDERRLS